MSAKENPGAAPGVSSGHGGGESNRSCDFSIKSPSINLPKKILMKNMPQFGRGFGTGFC
ncbi:MAG TPA: hypothetical protein PKM69_07925 [Bacteroidales bacterium]|nr:hypothetical protein [Bacteroidales bacterium]